MHQSRAGVRLKAWLKDERRTQKWLAEQIGTRQTEVSRWTLGREPPIAFAIAIRSITGIGVEEWAIPAAPISSSDLEHRKAS